MANVNIKTAVQKRKSRHNISSRHITTLGVNDIRVTNVIDCIKGDKIAVDLTQFSRLSPLVAPTFGDFKIKTYAFFVPYRTIWQHVEDFIADSSDSSIGTNKDPINLCLDDFMTLFTNNYATSVASNSYSTCNGTSYSSYSAALAVAHDIIVNIGANYYVHVLTAEGRLLFNNLIALGYQLPTYFTYNSSTSSDEYKWLHNNQFSLYPLLALARVFYDWLYPPQYVTQGSWGYLFTDLIYEAWTLNHTTVIGHILGLFMNCYDQSFWTSLWSQPNQVAASGNLSYFSKTIDSNGDSVASDDYGTFTEGSMALQPGVDTTWLSASALRWLQSVNDFVIRNNIGGSRYREFAKAHFGYVSSNENTNTSQFIKCITDHVTIQDVTNTAHSQVSSNMSSVLGEQGGKGYSSGSNSIRFECKEFGMLLFVTTVVPAVGYTQGIKPWAKAVNDRFRFWTPEFDGVGMEAVPRDAVFANYAKPTDWSKVAITSLDDVFGFAPMYSYEYKVPFDFLTGDFLFATRNTGLDSYHTFRDVLYGRSNLALDANFIATDNQAQRVFAYTGSNTNDTLYAQYDKIFSFFRFDVTRYSDAKSLSDSLPLFNRSGENTSLEYEGQVL